jgi:hypothetical protein
MEIMIEARTGMSISTGFSSTGFLKEMVIGTCSRGAAVGAACWGGTDDMAGDDDTKYVRRRRKPDD